MILLEGQTNGLRWRVQADRPQDDVITVEIRAERPHAGPMLDAIATAAACAQWCERMAAAWRNYFGAPQVSATPDARDAGRVETRP